MPEEVGFHLASFQDQLLPTLQQHPEAAGRFAPVHFPGLEKNRSRIVADAEQGPAFRAVLIIDATPSLEGTSAPVETQTNERVGVRA